MGRRLGGGGMGGEGLGIGDWGLGIGRDKILLSPGQCEESDTYRQSFIADLIAWALIAHADIGCRWVVRRMPLW